jgi:geranylgeranyl diphosphate synthase, type I
MSSYDPGHPELRRSIDDRLERVLRGRREDIPDAVPLIDEIARVIEAGGKRLRPAFCYWGYRSATRDAQDPILNAAASLELLHTFAIVHDDIMDSADGRRGVPSVNAIHGDDVALLVGDLALVLADDLFMHSGFAAPVVARGFDCYSRMRQEVIAGQFLDLQASRRPEIDEDQARRIAVLKSGRYSIEEPLAIGAVLGGGDGRLLAALGRVSRPLGEAFQLRDDLLGTFGISDATGKSVESDIRQGKRNILFAMTLARTTGRDHSFFVDRWGGEDLSSDEVARLRELVDTSGARAATEQLLEDLWARVDEALDGLPVADDACAALRDLAVLATQRES